MDQQAADHARAGRSESGAVRGRARDRPCVAEGTGQAEPVEGGRSRAPQDPARALGAHPASPVAVRQHVSLGQRGQPAAAGGLRELGDSRDRDGRRSALDLSAWLVRSHRPRQTRGGRLPPSRRALRASRLRAAGSRQKLRRRAHPEGRSGSDLGAGRAALRAECGGDIGSRRGHAGPRRTRANCPRSRSGRGRMGIGDARGDPGGLGLAGRLGTRFPAGPRRAGGGCPVGDSHRRQRPA